MGAGPLKLVGSPAVGIGPWRIGPGAIEIWLPTGGNIPAAALYANGGPLDTVTAGMPWDMAFVNQWRQLTVRTSGWRAPPTPPRRPTAGNNAATGQRTVLVDGWPAVLLAATSTAVPANTPVVVGAGCPMQLSEMLVWNGLVSDADLRSGPPMWYGARHRSTASAQRIKWGVPLRTSIPPGDGDGC